MSMTNEQIKQIIDGAPDGATHVATYIDDMYLRKAVPLGMELFSPILGKWEWCKDVTILRNAKDLSDLAEILALRERVAQQQDTIDKLLTLLNAADCPCCDKSGGYHDGYGLVQQCQWCDEFNKLKENTNERD